MYGFVAFVHAAVVGVATVAVGGVGASFVGMIGSMGDVVVVVAAAAGDDYRDSCAVVVAHSCYAAFVAGANDDYADYDCNDEIADDSKGEHALIAVAPYYVVDDRVVCY